MPPKVPDAYREQQRREILRVALRVFAARGLARASMQDVVDATGKSRGWVYLYFTNKEDLARALFEDLSKDLDGELAALLVRPGSTWEALEAFIDVVATSLAGPEVEDEHAFVIEFAAAARAAEGAQLLAFGRYQAVLRRLTERIEVGAARGDLTPQASPGAIASAVIAFLDGLSQHRYFLGASRIETGPPIAAFKIALRAMLGCEPPRTEKGCSP